MKPSHIPPRLSTASKAVQAIDDDRTSPFPSCWNASKNLIEQFRRAHSYSYRHSERRKRNSFRPDQAVKFCHSTRLPFKNRYSRALHWTSNDSRNDLVRQPTRQTLGMLSGCTASGGFQLWSNSLPKPQNQANAQGVHIPSRCVLTPRPV